MSSEYSGPIPTRRAGLRFFLVLTVAHLQPLTQQFAVPQVKSPRMPQEGQLAQARLVQTHFLPQQAQGAAAQVWQVPAWVAQMHFLLQVQPEPQEQSLPQQPSGWEAFTALLQSAVDLHPLAQPAHSLPGQHWLVLAEQRGCGSS
jgi:hypothetical protein